MLFWKLKYSWFMMLIYSVVLVSLLLLFSSSVVSDSLWPHGLQHARLPCPSPTPETCSNSCPSSQWCHLTISSSVVPFSCLQSFPASVSLPVSQFFASGGQSIGVSSSVLPVNRWCHPTISSSAVPFSCLQSFPASGSFLVSQLFTSDGQGIGATASASASVLPMNIQDWFTLGWTGWISLLSKGLLRVFSNTTVQKCQFFSTHLSLWSNSHIYTWLLEKT